MVHRRAGGGVGAGVGDNALNWPEIMRRMNAGEELEDLLGEQAAEERMSFRIWLGNQGERGAEALARYDAWVRAADLGIDRAQAVWHSISDAQRRLVAMLGVTGRTLERFGNKVYLIRVRNALDNCTISRWTPRLATVRNLASRELLEWTGGAFDPEASAVATERLRFVLKWGPRTDIENPWTEHPKPIPELPA